MKKHIVLIPVLLIVMLVFFFKLFEKTERLLIEKPTDWMAYQRAYPYWKINSAAYYAEMKKAANLHKESQIKANWELLGPTNIGGRITDVEVSPASPSTWYVGAATGGIFKTTDAGQSWQLLFHYIPFVSIGDLAIDPNNANIIYAGTGEANASSFSFLGGGVYKSIDGGSQWTFCGLPNSAYIGRIVVDKFNSNRIFVAACGNLFTPNPDRGVYRSNNGGNSWEKVLYVSDSTAAIDIVQHPQNGQILYAAMWERMRGRNYRRSKGWTSGIYKTTDGGNTWIKLTQGLPAEEMGRIGLAISQSNPNVLYAFVDMVTEARVYKTTDGGVNWFRCNDAILANINSYFGWYFGQIRVDPSNEQRVYVMGVDLYRSDDGGQNWTQLAGYYNMDIIHVDHHAMAFAGNTVINGNDGGLYLSFDYGNNWQKINNLPITQFYDIEIDYQLPERIYGGTQDNFSIGTQTGQIYDWQAFLGGDGFYTVVDYTNSDVFYMEYQYGNLYKTNDGGISMYYIGNSWQSDRTNWSSPYVMHPVDPEILYFGTYRVWKTTDGGYTWTTISDDLTKGNDGSGWHTISTMAISSVNPDIVLVGTDDGKIHVSTNGGTQWTDISNGVPDRWITRVVCDPNQSDVIYATVSGFRWDEPYPHVLRSDNLGQTWIDISGNLPNIPVNCLVVDPLNGNLFVGTDAGVFYSVNGGQSWMSLSGNMGNIPVVAMKLHHPTRKLVVGTYGLSAWGLDLQQLTEIAATSQPTNESVTVYPNPVRKTEQCIISFSSGKWVKWRAYIYDQQGKICDVAEADKTEQIVWKPKRYNGFPASDGVYFVHIEAYKTRYVSKLVILSD